MDEAKAQFLPANPLNTAVLFLAFNRPQMTKQVFKAIRRARPPRLYFAVDGPRENRLDDTQRIKDVFDFVMCQIDWKCEVKTLVREENLGCKHAVSSAINWFFENEERGIILEDDCLPSQSFFWYCEELLEKYKDDYRIMNISGYNILDGQIEYPFSYYFGHIGFAWGWSTWRRSWRHFDLAMSDWPDFKALGLHRFPPFSETRNKIFEQTFHGEINTWDYQWNYAIAKNNGLSAIPIRSLIKNIGFGKDATHSPENGGVRALIENNECVFPLTHPEFIFPNKEFDDRVISFVKMETRSLLISRIIDRKST